MYLMYLYITKTHKIMKKKTLTKFNVIVVSITKAWQILLNNGKFRI